MSQEFPRPRPSRWTRSYFVSTAGNVTSKTIRHYVVE
ncbi:MAG: transposase [Chloroflexota bacterium]